MNNDDYVIVYITDDYLSLKLAIDKLNTSGFDRYLVLPAPFHLDYITGINQSYTTYTISVLREDEKKIKKILEDFVAFKTPQPSGVDSGRKIYLIPFVVAFAFIVFLMLIIFVK